MINKTVAGRKWDFRQTFAALLIISVFFTACNPEQNDLGINIFPSGDTMRIYTDTITDMDVMVMKASPRMTSVQSITDSESRNYLLGSIRDTISGLSSAGIVTQLVNSSTALFGDEGLIDSVYISLYVDEVEGDTTYQTRIMINELTESLEHDTLYYSDYSVEGKYSSNYLVDEEVILKPNTVYDFLITDEDFIDRLRAAARTDTVFYQTNVIQEVVKGFYIHTDLVEGEGGSLAKVSMGNTYSNMRFKYLHDSVNVDTATVDDWSVFKTYFHYRMYSNSDSLFTKYMCQKINLFNHDYSGTYLASILGDTAAHPQIGYVQGMAGVNTRISIKNFDRYFDEGLIAINAANIVFYVVSDSISGIQEENYHDRLLMYNQVDDTTKQIVYDYLLGADTHYFGQITQSNEVIAFYDPIYFYNFHIGRHVQSVYAGEEISLDFILYPSDELSSSALTKFWTNYSSHKGAMRLELIYTKF